MDVEAFRRSLDVDTLTTVDALRTLIASCHDGLTERIKWNAPSFCHGGDDRITLGIERKGGVRVVFHRGAKAKDMAGFVFDDPDRIARWPAADRGVAVFADAGAVAAKAEALCALCARWIDATAP
ncbi:DUF1801 domain-containing protein [Sphingomonas crocodyli]|uniref:DUF1801 domain-containing protein n=1 Tax=Sphingomonas crocodyli TaxID=1979270 RepID=A0A437LUT1_9SPHN|nr:DUF1801 domain-containing protein [Sphingomonas crocodyli]RVT89191.1 DUF1801 domain-containing protein [Sphingomonas crocodyli]